jgi:hypothetical protein
MATSMSETITTAEPVDLLSKFDPIIQTRETLLAAGVEDPFNLVMEQVLSPTRAICNGRDTILLGTLILVLTGLVQSLRGQETEIPTVSEAVRMQL